MIDWLKEIVCDREINISPEDFDLFHLVDEPEQAVDIIDEFYSKYLLSPNF
jgi:predicted Rossmann-fold nucleotide-binding protein